MAKSTGAAGTPRWGHTTVDTACLLDCPDACSLAVTVENGKIVTIDGSTHQDVTKGFICGKVRRFDERVYGSARVKHPAVRIGAKGDGRFKRVTWNDALEAIATRMIDVRKEFGGEAILPFSYGGSNGLLSQDTTDAALFRRLGASRLDRTVCAAPTGAAALALYGKMPGVTYADYVHSRLIVIWGANPSASGIHLVPYIREAKQNGATVVVIDPRRTPLARQADLHLALRPGTDLPVALAVHRYLATHGLTDAQFLHDRTHGVARLLARADAWPIERTAEEAGIAPGALQQFAELYGRTSPAVIRCGWGLERNRNGGNAAMAVLALPAVAGKFGVRGGGYSMSNSSAWNLSASAWIGADEPPTRVVNMNHLGRALLEYDDPAVKVLFVYNCNPVSTMPDQNRVVRGLRRDDLFTVVFEQAHTDTVRFADVVLPATTFLETYDVVRSYGVISLQLARPVIDTVGEARPNVEVFSELASRIGLADASAIETDAEALLRVSSTLPEKIRGELLERAAVTPPMGATPIQFVDVFPNTPDGKVDLFAEQLDADAPRGLYGYQADGRSDRYPLALISPATSKTISSTLGELQKGPAAVQMHPDDAEVRGVEDGDTVRLFNDLGEVHCPVAVTLDVRPGTISLPKGLWSKATLNGSTANALVPDTLTDLGGGACFNDARVQAERIVTTSLGSREMSISISGHTRVH